MIVTKLEAARLQLHTALDLYFNDGDDISIHTLVGASHEVLRNICESRGLSSIKGAFVESQPKEDRKDLINKLNAPRSFLKHANNDPDGEIEFNPEINDIWLMDACSMYTKLTGVVDDRRIQLFSVWFGRLHPQSLIGVEAQRVAESLASSKFAKDRKVFFETANEAMDKLSA